MALVDSVFGKHVYLRSVTNADAEKIYELRYSGENIKFLHKSTRDEHNDWLEKQIKSLEDYYFCIVNNNSQKIVGAVGLYNFSLNSAEWGRWVVNADPLAAVESFILLMSFAFRCKIEKVFCFVEEDNAAAMRFHSALDYSLIKRSGERTEFVLARDDWPEFEQSYKKRFRLN